MFQSLRIQNWISTLVSQFTPIKLNVLFDILVLDQNHLAYLPIEVVVLILNVVKQVDYHLLILALLILQKLEFEVLIVVKSVQIEWILAEVLIPPFLSVFLLPYLLTRPEQWVNRMIDWFPHCLWLFLVFLPLDQVVHGKHFPLYKSIKVMAIKVVVVVKVKLHLL